MAKIPEDGFVNWPLIIRVGVQLRKKPELQERAPSGRALVSAVAI
jgi:hypothetical protein